jgi:uncharacterized protein (DUF2267 family)
MENLGPDRRFAWHTLGAVLRTLRDRLPLGLSAHLGAQLPLLVRGLYYDQWQPSEQPKRWRSNEEFFAMISGALSDTRPVDPAAAARAVFQVIDHFIDPAQVANVRQALPEDVRRLWPEGRREDSADQTAA